MERALYSTGWVLMTLMIPLMVATMLHYFGNDPSNYFQPEVYLDRLLVVRVHMAAGIVAALAGPLQFVPAIRNKYRAAHRTLGKIYIVAVIIGAVFGLMIATTALGGLISQMGFSLMSILWAGTALAALKKIRDRDFLAHRRWMIRSFAVTYGFVSLRIIFPTLELGVGLDQTTAFQITSWACWTVNLIRVEVAVRGGRIFGRSVGN